MPSILKKQPTKFQNLMTIISWVYDLKHDYEYGCKSCFFQVVASVNCDLMAGVYNSNITAKWKRWKFYSCSHWQIQEIQNTKKQGDMCFTRWGVTAILCLQPRDRPWSAGLPTRHDSSNQTFVTTITSHHFPTTTHIGPKDPGPVVERLVNTHSRFL